MGWGCGAGPGFTRCQEGPAPGDVTGRLGRESGQQLAVTKPRGY